GSSEGGAAIQRTPDTPPGAIGRPAPGADLAVAEPDDERPDAVVRLEAETAWRLCTRGIQPGTALARFRIPGDRQLAEVVCQIVSIVY
ncbi:hypothetical protein ABZS78_40970, partial [Streptomyces decoyicus]